MLSVCVVVMIIGQMDLSAQSLPTPDVPIALWPEGAPGAMGTNSEDFPTITAFFPPVGIATGAAMVICPGGGYSSLASHEGKDYALWLNQQGIAGFVLKYRLGSHGYRHPRMLEDAARAVRLVRFHAADWTVDARRVGIMGSSAGGHLASTLLTHYDAGQPGAADPIDRLSSRPDIGILCYPVITMGQPFTHKGSLENLLGKDPDTALVRELSNELHVTSDTPQCFIFHTSDDPVVPVENSLMFAAALRQAGVPFALHIYPHGRHGIGLGSKVDDPSHWHPWTHECRLWLKEQGFGK
ncbi:MAG TPA: alpha/beta hydrolase [Candidatus Baltobacteraceae bacterium]|jgi:acetyl esterase/lipase|nr:alpha/beta hydrolase [Candidatus Baltobacteraceae bacterium]